MLDCMLIPCCCMLVVVRGWNRPQLPVERYRWWLPVERYRWYCMVCGMMGELTKLCAYGFSFWFQVPLHLRGRSRRRSMASHTHMIFPHGVFWDCTLIWHLFMVVGFKYDTWFRDDVFIQYFLMNVYEWINQKWNFWTWILGRYKLVSEPWFEGFGHSFGCVWTQTKELV